MVHLGKIATDKEIKDSKVVSDINSDELGVPGHEAGAEEYGSSVYGSRFAAIDLPRHEMPEDEMPREVAYRMIKYAAVTATDRVCGDAMADKLTGTISPLTAPRRSSE